MKISDIALNGHPLDNPEFGWILDRSTTYPGGTTLTRPEATVPGFDGSWEMDGVETTTAIDIVVSTPESRVPGLINLLRTSPLDMTFGSEGRGARVEVSAITPTLTEDLADDPTVSVKATLVVPGIWLRGPEVTETVALETDTKTCNFLAGMTGKVSDGLLVLTGPLGSGVRVQDVGGMSWVRYTQPIPAGSALRIDQTFGRAYLVTAAAPWTGGTEVTQHLETGPGPYPLRLTPTLSTSDPSITQPKLKVTSTGRAAESAISLRARPAYNL